MDTNVLEAKLCSVLCQDQSNEMQITLQQFRTDVQIHQSNKILIKPTDTFAYFKIDLEEKILSLLIC